MNEWWTLYQSNQIGGYGGAILGTAMGLVGALAGMLAPRGIGRRWVLGMLSLVVLVGVVSLIAGVVAVSVGQPRHVFYPLLLVGLVIGAVGGGLMPVIVMRYREADRRRLEAEELRRG